MLKPEDQTRNTDVQLEDLLRFKQAERPDAAYWNRFDRELHQRMLKTLVKKDPFYRQVFRGLTGRLFPAGLLASATAALALLALAPIFEPSSVAVPVPVPLAASTPRVPAPDSAVPVPGVEVVDYAIDSISVGEGDFQQDFGMDRVEATGFTQADYSVQEAAARTGGAMLASLTF